MPFYGFRSSNLLYFSLNIVYLISPNSQHKLEPNLALSKLMQPLPAMKMLFDLLKRIAFGLRDKEITIHYP